MPRFSLINTVFVAIYGVASISFWERLFMLPPDIADILKSLSPSTQKNILSWLDGDFPQEIKDQILDSLRTNPRALEDSFGKQLVFGTGGLRSIVGVGSNRMNLFNVRKATQGLCNYLTKRKRSEHPLVIIGFDSRNNSKEFAEEVAKVLLANEIKVALFKNPRPVALISFGVRVKSCAAGVMITASHNPPQYNGYKVYMHTGGQVVAPADAEIMEEVNQLTGNGDIVIASLTREELYERVELIDVEFDGAYLEAVRSLQLHPKDNFSSGHILRIVYSNLHGSGFPIVPKILSDWGFSCALVEKQKILDGNFPTVTSPNPEEISALSMGLKQMQEESADLFFATDPDADRLGVACMWNSEPFIFNGNAIACLLAEHILKGQSQPLNSSYKIVKSLVTTEMLAEIAKNYGVDIVNVRTGFKYIGEKIEEWSLGPESYLFGAEESYGYLYGSHVRDKDAPVASATFSELALQEKLRDRTPVEFLLSLYEKYGYFLNRTISVDFSYSQGQKRMQEVLSSLRAQGASRGSLGGKTISNFEDYLQREGKNVLSGGEYPLQIGKADILRYQFLDGSWLVIRPSGTEPKMKVYFEVVVRYSNKTSLVNEILSRKLAAERELNTFIDAVKEELDFF
ncbi:phospho-sugar mutase [Chlamydiifrater volucris]|uniref:phospho-sugar mutase n=1 Tax=Chlamydiifrater volucris TaxID=2681470 RepID=UPI001FE9516E|nr:phospho-sugar mutase [Chlamydiifrater volucris]